MNVIEFKSQRKPLAFCFIDNTYQYQSSWSKELIKNLSDYSISNIFSKGYDIFQSQNPDTVLRHVAELNYSHAVVFSTGTEFINGRGFFNEIEKLTSLDFFLAGHILDRGDAYYELHHQCYIVNLKKYKEFNYPVIGQQELGSKHTQTVPYRDMNNIHDDYTPRWITHGSNIKHEYLHKCHGWNILSVALENQEIVLVFENNIRNNKKHYYPENQKEFLKNISWAHSRYDYCANEFVHTDHTDGPITVDYDFEQIITPASGCWFAEHINKDTPINIILYDYNDKALDYWKTNVPIFDNVTYEFVKINLLTDNFNKLIKNQSKKTLFNISNILCYEGTAMFYSLEYRLHKEIDIRLQIPDNWQVVGSEFSWTGFAETITDIKNLKKPTWHMNGDWNE